MKKVALVLILMSMLLMSCSENYSNGERVGMVTKFSKSGILFKSWEGSLNLTQTGMNTGGAFEFSIDRDSEDPNVVMKVDSAANFGWKVKLKYHETFGWNWFGNRGDTNHFITEVEILDKSVAKFSDIGKTESLNVNSGKVVDTVYVVIVDKDKIIK